MDARPIAGAILIGSALLALAVYFGLRGRGEPVPASAPAATPAQGPAPSRAEVEARAAADATVALEARRDRFVAACGGVDAGAVSQELTFSLAFDSQGREVGRGISDDRRAPANPVPECLRKLRDTPLKIEPPGEPVSVVVPFRFP